MSLKSGAVTVMSNLLRFVPSVRHENQLLVPLGYYPGLRVPAGVPVYEPIAVSFGRMSQLAPDKLPAPAGLTVPSSLSVKLVGQWRQASASPVQWQFQGGELQLRATVAVYMIDKFRPVDKLFELILSHELLHVKDDIDIVSQYLPQELPRDEYVKKYLLEQKVVDNAMYCNWFLADRFEKYVRDIWVLERNRRGAARDSGALYEQYKQAIVKLMPPV
jgi:hypothetical protein